jgi:hypothetical protein
MGVKLNTKENFSLCTTAMFTGFHPKNIRCIFCEYIILARYMKWRQCRSQFKGSCISHIIITQNLGCPNNVHTKICEKHRNYCSSKGHITRACKGMGMAMRPWNDDVHHMLK